VVVAALGPPMRQIAGEMTQGTKSRGRGTAMATAGQQPRASDALSTGGVPKRASSSVLVGDTVTVESEAQAILVAEGCHRRRYHRRYHGG